MAALDSDPRFFVEHAVLDVGEDAHEVGRELAARAVARIGGTLAYDGTRPLAVLDSPAHETWPVLAGVISITHTRTQVFAVAARTNKLGIDLVDHDDARLERIAGRFLADEQDAIERFAERLVADGQDGIARAVESYVASTADRDASKRAHAAALADARQRARAMCFAAKEAGLKALGLGLLDGGVFDGACPVRVVELDPPRYAPITDDTGASQELTLELHDVGFSVLAIAFA